MKDFKKSRLNFTLIVESIIFSLLANELKVITIEKTKDSAILIEYFMKFIKTV